MPLPSHPGEVTRLLQHLRDGDALVIQLAPIGRLSEILIHCSDARLMGIKPAQKRSAGGAAASLVIKLREPNAALCQIVDVGRMYFPAIAADIRVSHVVRKDNDDI